MYGNPRSLVMLDLSNNAMKGARLQPLMVALAAHPLRALDLSYNQVCMAGAGGIGRMLAQSASLETLSLAYNGLGDLGVEMLSLGTAKVTIVTIGAFWRGRPFRPFERLSSA